MKIYIPETIQIPDDWTPLSKDEQFKVVKLTAGSSDYAKVEKTFKDSMNAGGSTFNGVLSVSFSSINLQFLSLSFAWFYFDKKYL